MRKNAAALLGRLGDLAAAAPLKRALEDRNEDPVVKVEARRALTRLLGEPEASR